jgi:L-ribulose-5-phosphate 3-epimerase
VRFRTLLLFVAAIINVRAADGGPQIGLQSWTCRNMTFDELVTFADQHHLKYLQLFPKHLDPLAPREESLRKKAILAQHGLVCYTFGVSRTSLDPAANRRLFEFARLMGIHLIVVAPNDPRQWDNLEALVKEFDIKLAIHNEGKGTPYSDPATVRAVLAARDPRIGVCLDAGHLTESGFDAAAAFRAYHGRVFDIHLKDKKTITHDGKTEVIDVLDGTGDVNYAGLFAEIRREHWSGVVAIETDNPDFQRDPGPFVDSAIKFFHEHTR